MSKTYRIGIDVGGTFTDLACVDDAGTLTFVKTPSTPEDQSVGVLTGLGDLADRLGVDLAGLLSATDRIVHGTTVATNALLERKGAKVGLLTTRGHRDVLEMREGLKPDRYNLLMPPPEPLVPRQLRRGVTERVAHDGTVLAALDEAELDAEIARLRSAGVEAVAVAYLHSYRNPAHERRTAERLAALMPDAYVTLSSEVLPQIKEFERVSTTVVNAYVGPAVRRYLASLERRLAEIRFEGALFIILSQGGVVPLREAARLAAATVLSGPAGGVAGSRYVAALTGARNLIPFDMGGTSTDISLVADGSIALSAAGGLAGERIALRSLDIISIGAGGGSIARVDASGILQVGPDSAGSKPGPVCYGQGGTEPTVTDANLLLGYLDADHFLGGRRRLDEAGAIAVMDRLAARLGTTRDEAAAGIYRLVNLKMADGIRLMTLRRGVDPRGFAILSFGGAAGLHAVEVAREMEVGRVIVPAMASVLSAWGMLNGDLRYEVSRSHLADTARLDPSALAALFRPLETEATGRLRAWFDGPIRLERSAQMRYGEQIFEVDVPLDGLDLAAPGSVAALTERFHRRHEELYTYASPGQEVVLVNVQVAAVGAVEAVAPAEAAPADDRPISPVRMRRAFFDRWREVPVYAFEALKAGCRLTGPALIEAETTTVVLGEGDTLTADRFGWLDIRLRPGA
ncbi:hydantoinase/oxoprolinase family protein [Methylobacterium nodulans]|uniref:Hydantoinase/oxoprolinase n=1 Tax=Methylobacterium nodulans (strain LMG 21967 / CNCM I-2342 / ORS 2060) TaxID=460265 RepID=B8IJK0_METNO|nr:hydantoinase/oxoprolinase family protein [Methylobacterium nodulans]ACL58048.1 Hydantoinase/oxoprolinase [Methylobacterium nodulans ORS 2060]